MGTVNWGGRVEGGGAQSKEVLNTVKFVKEGTQGLNFCGLRNRFAEYFDLDVTEVGVELHMERLVGVQFSSR